MNSLAKRLTIHYILIRLLSFSNMIATIGTKTVTSVNGPNMSGMNANATNGFV